MLMFMGEYNHTIDAKGRLIVPAKFREQLGEQFILAKGLDGCLAVYPTKEWESFLEKIQSLPLVTNSKARSLTRQLSSGAMECELDKQGRVLVSQNLRAFANLEKEVVLAGNINKIEIWNKERWEEIGNVDMDELADELSRMGVNL